MSSHRTTPVASRASTSFLQSGGSSIHGFPSSPAPSTPASRGVFHSLLSARDVTICEREGELITAPNLDTVSGEHVSLPAISVQRDPSQVGLPPVSSRSAFISQQVSTYKQAFYVWQEIGMLEALEVIAKGESKDEVHPWIKALAKSALWILKWAKWQGVNEHSMGDVVPVENWVEGLVRCIAWHPHVDKLAVALHNESVHIYKDSSSPRHVLKHKQQKLITGLAWKPHSASFLAVACREHILMWNLDPTSLATRVPGNCASLLSQPGHSPIVCIQWSPQGDLLMSGSLNQGSPYVWDVSMQQSTPLMQAWNQQVGYLRWSPDGSKVLVATMSSTFRVFETETWTWERWKTVKGRVRAGAWSPCGKHLVFATDSDPVLFDLSFQAPNETAKSKVAGSEAAQQVANFQHAALSDGHSQDSNSRVFAIEWDPKGERLVVGLQKWEALLLYRTRVFPSVGLQFCGMIYGPMGQVPQCIQFKPHFEEGALLTVAWWNGSIQYLPLYFLHGEESEKQTMGFGRPSDVSTRLLSSPAYLLSPQSFPPPDPAGLVGTR